MTNERVCLVTGATSGIGRATAQKLASMGLSVVVHGRDPSVVDTVAAQIRASTGNEDVGALSADLASLESIRHAADRLLDEHDRLDVLINNAGVNLTGRRLTVDGFETTFAVNHLAPFLLTSLLLDLLERSAPSRVVNVTSTAFKRDRIDFADLQGERNWNGISAYAQSKLASVLFTYELARRLQGTGITANCVHPGMVRGTNLGHGERFPVAIRVLWALLRPLQKTPEEAAEASVYIATSPALEGVSGRFFIDKRERRTSEATYDRALAQRLWTISAELTGQVDSLEAKMLGLFGPN
jgi:retinol dehydrogenase-14